MSRMTPEEARRHVAMCAKIDGSAVVERVLLVFKDAADRSNEEIKSAVHDLRANVCEIERQRDLQWAKALEMESRATPRLPETFEVDTAYRAFNGWPYDHPMDDLKRQDTGYIAMRRALHAAMDPAGFCASDMWMRQATATPEEANHG